MTVDPACPLPITEARAIARSCDGAGTARRMLYPFTMTIHSVVKQARALNHRGRYEAAYELCAAALEHGVDHTAIRMALARALAAMGCEREWRIVLLGAMVRWRRRGIRSQWTRSWVSTTPLRQQQRKAA